MSNKFYCKQIKNTAMEKDHSNRAFADSLSKEEHKKIVDFCNNPLCGTVTEFLKGENLNHAFTLFLIGRNITGDMPGNGLSAP